MIKYGFIIIDSYSENMQVPLFESKSKCKEELQKLADKNNKYFEAILFEINVKNNTSFIVV